MNIALNPILELESPVCDLHSMANVSIALLDDLSGTAAVGEKVTIHQSYRDQICFVVDDLQRRAAALEKAYYSAIEDAKTAKGSTS